MCTSGVRAGQEVGVPADCDNLVTSQEPHLRIYSLVFATCRVWTLHSKLLQSCFRRKLIWDSHHPSISVLFSSSVSRTLQHLRSFCTKSGQALACTHQTGVSGDSQLSLSTSKPEGPFNSSCESLTPGCSFWGAEQEWGKSLKIKLVPCEIIIYSSHKCLWCTECYRNLHSVGFLVEGGIQLLNKFKSGWILRPLWICWCSSNSVEWF